MHAIAFVLASGLFIGFLYGHVLDSFLASLMLGIYEYKLAVVLIATSPLLASLLVGMAYSQRALRRRRAQSMAVVSHPPTLESPPA